MAAGILRSSSILLAIFALLITGCAQQKTLYSWGPYQPVSYQLLEDDGADPQSQVLQMEEHLVQVESMKKALPPGYHAQLGLLYGQLGKMDRMRAEFLREKELFPEAAAYIDFLLAKKDARGVAK